MNQEFLKDYARTVVTVGSNLKAGEELVIASDVSSAEFVHLLAEAAYEKGAKKVSVIWRDEELSKLSYRHCDRETLCEVPAYVKESRRYIVDRDAAYIQVSSADPDAFASVDAELLAAVSRASHKEMSFFFDATITNTIRWTICAVPSAAWAKKVLPGLSEEEAVEKMWELILTAARAGEDGVGQWKKHCENLAKRNEFLNREQFASLTFRNAHGTDLTLKMPENYVFMGGSEQTRAGVPFAANMPTEEVFSAPHKYGANGTVAASLPLVHNGKIVRDFGFTFENGKIVDYYAAEGADVLKGILDTDEGSRYLGEVALVPYESPIRKLGVLFYSTLFDENASCHLAIGKAYASSVVGGNDMTKEQLAAAGINVSFEHVDFMFGTADMLVQGVRKDGTVVDIIKNGSFVI